MTLGGTEGSDGKEGLPLWNGVSGSTLGELDGMSRTYERGRFRDGLASRDVRSPDSTSRGSNRLNEVSSALSSNEHIRTAHSFPEKCPVSISHPTILPSAPNLTIVLQKPREVSALSPRLVIARSIIARGRARQQGLTNRK